MGCEVMLSSSGVSCQPNHRRRRLAIRLSYHVIKASID